MVHEASITLKQMRALAAILKSGSLTAAAEALNVTPPAVSTQLRSLEQNFGTGLLSRGPDGRVALTPAGEEVLAAITQIEVTLTTCYKRVNALREGRAGHVALGVVSTGKYFAPGLVVRARNALPGLDIALRIGNRGEIIEALRRREVDLAIMGRPPRDPPVEAVPLGAHPHILIAPPDHPLAQGCDTLAERLLEETFLCREAGSGTRILSDRFLDRIGEGRPYKSIELGSNETIKQAVMAGLGIALISAHTVIAEMETGRLASIRHPGLPIVRHWFLVHPAGLALTPSADRFHRFVADLSGAFLPTLPG